MKALTTIKPAAAKAAPASAFRIPATIPAKAAGIIERAALAIGAASAAAFFIQVLITGTASPWVALPSLAVLIPAFMPAREEGGSHARF